MPTSEWIIPELDKELWNAWVQKGRRGDASRVRRWRVLGGVALVAGGLAGALLTAVFRS
jgi:hypothetical protein